MLVEAAGILGGDVTKYDKLKALLPPVGDGRPQQGAARSESRGFEAISNTSFTHIDPLAGTDVAGGEVARWFDAVANFAKRNTPAGGVVVP